MVEVTIYFHHGGEWLTSPEPHYDRECVTYWKGYDPDLISFIDLVNEYIYKLGFVGVQELIVLAPTGKYFEIIGDEGVRTLTSFISTEYKSIHLFATEDCELSVDVTDIVMCDGSFLLSPIVNEGSDCSESEDDTKKVELVVVKSDKKNIEVIFILSLISSNNYSTLLFNSISSIMINKAKQGKQPTKKHGKQLAKQGKESDRGKKRQLRRGLVDENEASEEDINCTAPQPTQESQFEYASSSNYFPVAEDDDEDPRLRRRTISEEAFLTRLRKRQNPQEPIGSRVVGFKGPTNLTWNGQGAVTTNQLQKLRPRRG
ncbi:hypothetical protein R3W88_026255 [Solanum pinnatisectum]|uniref:PB1-like domain-containing protein n=1 Tax=Solanum pinnatisectum TaxID=50273 RepID=A0AAV9LCM6_9SOLN|nr:hypothetical protein R3W88_026255 [Solanum pinnatisectum]